MRRRFLVASLVLMTGALTLTSCAGADQEGSEAHRMSVWVSGTSFGEDIGTLIADNARVPEDVPNGTGAVHAACGTLLNDAEMANTESAVAGPRRDRPPHPGLRPRGRRGERVLRRGKPRTRSCWPQSERNGIKAEALYDQVLQRIRQIDGKVVSTTTTTDNSAGGIFG